MVVGGGLLACEVGSKSADDENEGRAHASRRLLVESLHRS